MELSVKSLNWVAFITSLSCIMWWIFYGFGSSGGGKEMTIPVLIAVAVAIWGASSTKTFKEIQATQDLATKSPESYVYRPNFITFNHRGKQLFGAVG